MFTDAFLAGAVESVALCAFTSVGAICVDAHSVITGVLHEGTFIQIIPTVFPTSTLWAQGSEIGCKIVQISLFS